MSEMTPEREDQIRDRFQNNYCLDGRCYCNDPYEAVRDLLAALEFERARGDEWIADVRKALAYFASGRHNYEAVT